MPAAWVAGAAIVGAGISAAASSRAAGRQARSAENAQQLQWDMYNQQREDLTPYREAGYGALNTINEGVSQIGQFTHQFNADDLKTNLAPNYNFMLGQGLGATQNLMNQGGGLLSGNTIKGVNDYVQNYASNAYQQAFQNYTANQTNIFNRLSAVAGLGQTATQTGSQNAVGISPGMANAVMSQGQAQAAGTVGTANAISNGISNAGSWYMLNNLLK